MLYADLVERADDGALEQAPDVLDPVGVDVPTDPFVFAVVDGLMPRVMVMDTQVGAEFIRVDRFGFVLDVFFDELVQCALLYIGDVLESDLPVALQRTSNPHALVGSGTAMPTALFPVPFPSSNHRFVNFNDTEQGGLKVIGSHRFADTVTEVPCGFVRDAESPLDLVGRRSFLALDHEINGREPLPQRQLGVVEDGPRGDGEPIPAIVTIELVAGGNLGDRTRSAAGATHTIRPAKELQVVSADFFGVEAVDNVDQARRLGPIELFVLTDVGLVN